MKKIITGILAASILTSGTVFAVDFTDTKGHWAEQTINNLVAQGVVDGYSDTIFDPDGTVTRAQYLKMIMETVNIKPDAHYEPGKCLEAKETDWYAVYLQKALALGLIPEAMIAGYKVNVEYAVDDDGKTTGSKVSYSGAFNGDLPINREEMAVLTQYFYQYTRNAVTYKEPDIERVRDFADETEISKWALASVKISVANGFVEGMDEDNFAPKENATRAQAATIIERVLRKQESDRK